MAGGGIKMNNTTIIGGADGITFVPSIDESGVLSWKAMLGTKEILSYNVPNPIKIKGEDGTDGKDGAKGETGAKIISQSLLGQDANGGNIYLQVFDDGTEQTFTAPKGKDGKDGEDGKDGQSPTLEKENWVFTLEDGTTVEKEITLVRVEDIGGSTGTCDCKIYGHIIRVYFYEGDEDAKEPSYIRFVLYTNSNVPFDLNSFINLLTEKSSIPVLAYYYSGETGMPINDKITDIVIIDGTNNLVEIISDDMDPEGRFFYYYGEINSVTDMVIDVNV